MNKALGILMLLALALAGCESKNTEIAQSKDFNIAYTYSKVCVDEVVYLEGHKSVQ